MDADPRGDRSAIVQRSMHGRRGGERVGGTGERRKHPGRSRPWATAHTAAVGDRLRDDGVVERCRFRMGVLALLARRANSGRLCSTASTARINQRTQAPSTEGQAPHPRADPSLRPPGRARRQAQRAQRARDRTREVTEQHGQRRAADRRPAGAVAGLGALAPRVSRYRPLAVLRGVRRSRIARMWSGRVPQHPPTMRAPSRTHAAASSARALGATSLKIQFGRSKRPACG
jgi:hypothetical protein